MGSSPPAVEASFSDLQELIDNTNVTLGSLAQMLGVSYARFWKTYQHQGTRSIRGTAAVHIHRVNEFYRFLRETPPDSVGCWRLDGDPLCYTWSYMGMVVNRHDIHIKWLKDSIARCVIRGVFGGALGDILLMSPGKDTLLFILWEGYEGQLGSLLDSLLALRVVIPGE